MFVLFSSQTTLINGVQCQVLSGLLEENVFTFVNNHGLFETINEETSLNHGCEIERIVNMDCYELADRYEVRHGILPVDLRVYLLRPAPTLSLCRHAEQGCGVAAKKSPVAAKKPAYKRAISVNKTKIPTNNGAWAQGIQGGDCGMRWCRRCSSDPRPRDRTWPWRTLGARLQPSSSLLHFYTSTSVLRWARPGSRGTSTSTSSTASPALIGPVLKIIIVICYIYVMSIKIASWVAGNVVTFLQP